MAKIVIKNDLTKNDRTSLGSTKVLKKYALKVWRTKNPKKIHILAKSGTQDFRKLMQTINIRRHHNGSIVEITYDDEEPQRYYGKNVIIR